MDLLARNLIKVFSVYGHDYVGESCENLRECYDYAFFEWTIFLEVGLSFLRIVVKFYFFCIFWVEFGLRIENPFFIFFYIIFIDDLFFYCNNSFLSIALPIYSIAGFYSYSVFMKVQQKS
jgi:hypothetical protein